MSGAVKLAAGLVSPSPATHKPGSSVWMPDKKEVYVKGQVVSWKGSAEVTVRSSADGHTETLKATKVFPINPVNQDGVPDNTSLMFLDEPSLLHNIKFRYDKNQIYRYACSYTANILIAVNPYQTLPLYSERTMDEYTGKSIGLKPPHVFAIGDHTYRSMRSAKKSQSVLISGESGAGKTETCKIMLRYLTRRAGTTKSSKGDLAAKILDANPILEAFGNAKTLRNNNSSRFGKFTELNFDKEFKINGSSIVVYLLERSRIVNQNEGERNYHSFYQLLAGASPSDKAKLHLQTAREYHYVNQSKVYDVDGIDDVKDYHDVRKAMDTLGFSKEEQTDIYKVVAAVLHLGNIKFVSLKATTNTDGVEIPDDDKSIRHASELLGLNEQELREKLTVRSVATRRGRGTAYSVPLNMQQAVYNRDAFAKTVYARLFDKIVDLLNRSMKNEHRDYHIGVLDIFGFEFFKHNSFEQFCINYANEKLQQHFNYQVLRSDQEIYANEGIPWTPIHFDDNSDCIEAIEKKGEGILPILDEQSNVPQSNDKLFTQKVHQVFKKHPRIKTARMGRFKGYRDEDAIVVNHFAGPVCYETDGFMDKNNDTLTSDLNAMIVLSSNAFFRSLFPIPDEDDPNASAKLKASIGKQFSAQLNQLMESLRSTHSHFIRCVKPNSVQRPGVYENTLVMNQLTFNGMVATLKVFSLGYPTRAHYSDIYDKYVHLMPKDIQRLDKRTFVEALLMGLEVERSEFALGLTRVFFKAGRLAFLDQLLGDDFHKRSKEVVAKIRKYLARKRFRRAAWTVLAFVIIRDLMHEKRDEVRKKRALASLGGDVPSEMDAKLWFNTHLKNARFRRIITNFGSDLSNAEALCVLLHQIEPEAGADTALKERTAPRRAAALLGAAKRVGCLPTWYTEEDLLRGSKGMNYVFVASLQMKHPSVEPSAEEREAIARAEELERRNEEMMRLLEEERKKREREEQAALDEMRRKAQEAQERAARAEGDMRAAQSRLEDQVATLTSQLREAEASLRLEREHAAQLESEVSSRNDALAEARREAEHLRNDLLAETEQQAAALKQQLSAEKQAAEARRSELEAERADRSAKERKLMETMSETQAMRATIDDLEQRLETALKDVAAGEARVRDLDSQMHQMKLAAINQQSAADQVRAEAELQIESLHDDLRAAKRATQDQERRREAAEHHVDKVQAALEEQERLAADRLAELEELRTQVEQVQASRKKAVDELEKQLMAVQQANAALQVKAARPKQELKERMNDVVQFRLLLVRPEKQGYVEKLTNMLAKIGVKYWQPRYLLLKNNFLVVAGAPETLDEPSALIDLSMCYVTVVPVEAIDKQFAFILTHRHNDTSHTFAATSEEDRNKWLSMIRESQKRNAKALAVFENLTDHRDGVDLLPDDPDDDVLRDATGSRGEGGARARRKSQHSGTGRKKKTHRERDGKRRSHRYRSVSGDSGDGS